MTDKKRIRAISINKSYKVILHTEGHTVISDEPLEEGGSDEGMNPYELIAGSLASCTAITIQMYLERKGWEIDELLVDVNLKTEKIENVSRTIFERNLIVRSKLDDAQLERVKFIANACPISKILEGGNNFVVTTLEKR
ncbi:MAG: OsmC family protein [Ignavibacteria bacterium]|nr:OsmC family protein [Ignavibacteria bacterium]